jgi:hypothetical protein
MSGDDDTTSSTEWSELFRVMIAILTDQEKKLLYDVLSDMPDHATWYDLSKVCMMGTAGISMRLADHIHDYWFLASDFEPEENEKDAMLAILNIPYENTALSAPPKCGNPDCNGDCRGYKDAWYAGCTLQCCARAYRENVEMRCPVRYCGAVMMPNIIGMLVCTGVHTITKSANKTG